VEKVNDGWCVVSPSPALRERDGVRVPPGGILYIGTRAPALPKRLPDPGGVADGSKEGDMDQRALLDGIGSGNLGRVVMARIPIGVDLLEAIQEIVRRERIRAGLILMGIGALQKAVFRNLKSFPSEYPIGPKDRLYFEVEGPLEMLSLSGYVVPRGEKEPLVHAHFSASTVKDERVVVYGGHLGEGNIAFVKVAVTLCVLEGLPMGKKWVEERQVEDLWVGSPKGL
jgi:predicted DNA-binding protein with PD1-like motif